jgi:GNAT superfamily N-acetyltransferase
MKMPSIRPAALDDAALAADLMTAAVPREPEDPILTEDRWRNGRKDFTFGRFIAELGGEPIAYLDWAHGPWDKLPERHCYVDVYLAEKHMGAQLLAYLWGWIEEEAAKQGALTLNAAAGEEETPMLSVLEKRGYERERADRVWILDLQAHGARLVDEAAGARERMRAEGITLTTLSDWPDPTRFEKLHALSEETRQDIPHSTPILPQPMEYFMSRANAPDHRADRWWLALDGDRPVAMSFLSFPPVRGHVWTGYTCCTRSHRGRGIARAVKLQTLAQAVELGIPSVRTDNDSENAAMLHINETLGYESLPGYVNFVRRLPARALR